MTKEIHTHGLLGQESPRTDGSLGAAAAITLAVLALVFTVSYPLVTGSVVAGVALVAGLLRAGLVALARRMRGRFAELDVPGVGTVEFRITPR